MNEIYAFFFTALDVFYQSANHKDKEKTQKQKKNVSWNLADDLFVCFSGVFSQK